MGDLSISRLDPQESLAGLSDGVDQHQVGCANLLTVNDRGISGQGRSEQVVLPFQGDGLDLAAVNPLEPPLEYRLAGNL
jgi:hypothetical protein